MKEKIEKRKMEEGESVKRKGYQEAKVTINRRTMVRRRRKKKVIKKGLTEELVKGLR